MTKRWQYSIAPAFVSRRKERMAVWHAPYILHVLDCIGPSLQTTRYTQYFYFGVVENCQVRRSLIVFFD